MPFPKREVNFLRFPKVGESYDYSQHGKIVEIKKVEGKKGYNFVQEKEEILFDAQGNEKKSKIKVDLGYRFEVIFEDGKILSVSQWSPFYAMQNAGIIEGCSMVIDHKEKGNWLITKLE